MKFSDVPGAEPASTVELDEIFFGLLLVVQISVGHVGTADKNLALGMRFVPSRVSALFPFA